MDRRSFLLASASLAGLGMAGCARKAPVGAATTPSPLPFYDALGPIPPIRAHIDRIFRVTVCLRPFRAVGPRIETERLGDKVVVHNYGHGGSGWSLSWGSADLAVRLAMGFGAAKRELAVIGCGALGLTAAITAQRGEVYGLRSTCEKNGRLLCDRRTRRDLGHLIRGWHSAAPRLQRSRRSGRQWRALPIAMYQSYLGMPGYPIEWTDRYFLSDHTPEEAARLPETPRPHDFATYRGPDFRPDSECLR